MLFTSIFLTDYSFIHFLRSGQLNKTMQEQELATNARAGCWLGIAIGIACFKSKIN